MKTYGVRAVLTIEGATHNQPRIIVAARSRAAAVRAFVAAGIHVTDDYVATYGGETWNDLECEVANSEPGRVFVARVDSPRTVDEFLSL